jgi:hypothetical protein
MRNKHTESGARRRLARLQGESTYVGSFCKHNHGSLRYVSGGECVTCRQLMRKDWENRHPGRKTEAQRQRRQRLRAEMLTMLCTLMLVLPLSAIAAERIPLPKPDPRGPHVQRESIPCAWTWGHVLPGGLFQTPCGAEINVNIIHENKTPDASDGWLIMEGGY